MDIGGIFASLMNVVGSPYHMLLLLIAVPAGMFFGAIPGLGGKLGIVLAIPFVFGMDPLAGAIFLISMHSVVHTGGAIPSILFGVPGTGPDAFSARTFRDYVHCDALRRLAEQGLTRWIVRPDDGFRQS
jgi:TctA family transporter